MMTPAGAPAPSGVARRWHAFLHGLGPIADSTPVRGGPRTVPGSDTRDRHVHLREVFVRADPERRRALDLLCVALFEFRSEGYGPGYPAELVVLSTETIRGHTTAVPVTMPSHNGPPLCGQAFSTVRKRPLILKMAISRSPTRTGRPSRGGMFSTRVIFVQFIPAGAPVLVFPP